MRCAIYFVPPPDDPLTVAAAQWLRRDPYTGAALVRPIDGLTDTDHAYLTALPRRYGFHATLKPPFQLAQGRSVQELERWLTRFCDRLDPVALETRLALIENFFALVPVKPSADLDMLAARIVTEFDGFRRLPSEDELARRDTSRLNSRQLSNLMNWGSPNIFDQFRFHMTLTGPIDKPEREHVLTVLGRHFGPRATAPLEIGQLVLAVEPEANAPFLVHSAHRFRTSQHLRIA